MTTDSNHAGELRTELLALIEDLEVNIANQRHLRRRIIRCANEYMDLRQIKYMGSPNNLYIGPDVDNKNTILLLGTSANSAYEQMEKLGKRVSLRRKRVNKGKANKELINNN